MSTSFFYVQPSQLTDNTRPWMDITDTGSPVLDDNILDTTIETTLDSRRESIMDAGIYSPAARDWIDFDTEMMNDGPAPMPISFEHSNGTNNPFVKLENQFAATQAWNGSRTETTTAQQYDGANTFGFDANYIPQSFAPVPAANNNPASFESSPNIFNPQPMMPSSSIGSPADSNAPWSPADTPKPQHAVLNKMNRSKSPGPRSHSPLNIRRDGIRKKNARFEIPAERTLLTIDTLISQSADDQEIKELKQQKRLLRNRQAALDSRQRKKQHTERLEEEKKVHSAVISELEEKLAMLQLRDAEWRQRTQAAVEERDHARHQVEVLQMEKEEMVKSHTIETGDLRKRNNFLVNQCQKLEHMLESGKSSAPSSGTFDDEFDIDSDFWEQSPFTDDYAATPKPKKESKAVLEEEKPVQGLLLILLLCGAYVASSQTPSASALPPLPQPLRTASAGILQNIFNEAGVSQSSQGRIMEAPDATSTSWLSSSGGNTVGLASSLDLLSQTLTATSAEQEREEMRQLTAAEYNDVTSKEFREPESIATRGRRQIAEGLASMTSKGGAADVYTRSLLWDRVDAEVVRRFAAFAQAAQASQNNDADAMSV